MPFLAKIKKSTLSQMFAVNTQREKCILLLNLTTRKPFKRKQTDENISDFIFCNDKKKEKQINRFECFFGYKNFIFCKCILLTFQFFE